jgi:arylformamidase
LSPERLDNSGWRDISVPLRTGMVHWPTDTPVQIERVFDVSRGDSHTLSRILMGSHGGTHIDAPAHFLKEGASIDQMPLDITVGQARILKIKDNYSIKPEELLPHRIRAGERILFKTRNSTYVWHTDSFVEDYVFLTLEAARFLVERKVKMVGTDYLSIGAFKDSGSEVHQILLGSGVWIIEGLDLSQVGPGRYELVCLPLKLGKADGAPARAIVRPRRAGSNA